MPPGLDQQPQPSAGISSLASKRNSTGVQGSARPQTPPNKRKASAVHPGIGVRLQPPAKRPNLTQTSQRLHTQAASANTARPQPFQAKPARQRSDRAGAAPGSKTAMMQQTGQKQHAPAGMAAPKGSLRTRKGNRLGQRARRALSEKMYGSEAKHVEHEPAQPHSSKAAGNTGGKTAGKTAGKTGGKSKQSVSSAPVAKHTATTPVHSRLQNHDRQAADTSEKSCREPDGPLLRGVVDESHPSWVAYRQHKAKLRLKPVGKKTVFRDYGGPVEAVADCAGPRLEPHPVLAPVDGTKQPSQRVPEDSGGLCRMAQGEMKRRSEKSWGDAGRGTVAELLPAVTVEQARGGDGQGSKRREPAKRGGRARNSCTVEDKMKGFHPSWIAAKQRKSQLAKLQELSITTPGGNKIKFDD